MLYVGIFRLAILFKVYRVELFTENLSSSYKASPVIWDLCHPTRVNVSPQLQSDRPVLDLPIPEG